jgi:hypothetical protein
MELLEAAAKLRIELSSSSWLQFPKPTRARPTRLFHYTPQAGLLGIIKSNVLWATNALYLNDSSELLYGLSVAREHMSAVVAKSDIVREFLRRAEQLLDLSVLTPGRQFYACCFCENPNLLSQWRAYADRGGGYAIGFDTEDLGRAAVKTHLSLFPMDYGTGGNSEKLAEDIGAVCQALERCAKQSPGNDEKLISAALDELKLALIFRIFWLKHPDFKEEQEWRILANFLSTDLSRVSFREGQTTPVPYVELGLADFGESLKTFPIREVVHGPNAHPQLASQSLESLFKKHGFDPPKIWGSQIPIRRP